jgi:hypothetical protein
MMSDDFPKSLRRSSFLKQFDPGTAGDPNNPAFDPLGDARDGDVSRREGKNNMELYHRPLEKLHGSAAHGIGLGVSGTQGSPGVTIKSGVAIDGSGRHIYLATGGQAKISRTATGDEPNQLVPPAGITLSTAGLTGDLLITVQWWETFDRTTATTIRTFDHTPWLRLLKPSEYDPKTQVVLGNVNLDGQGNVKTLVYGGAEATQRSGLSVPAQRVQFNRPVNLDGPSVHQAPAGEFRARKDGLHISVADGSDQVEISQGLGARFAQMSVSADRVSFGPIGKPASMVDTTNATWTVGTTGIAGGVVLQDKTGTTSLRLDGQTGTAALQRIEAIGQEVRVASNLAVEGEIRGKSNGEVHVRGSSLRVHAPDFILNGRTQATPARALVDDGDLLIMNFNNDFREGVQISSDLTLQGSLKGLGGQAIKVDNDLQINSTLRAAAGKPVKIVGDLEVSGALRASGGGQSIFANNLVVSGALSGLGDEVKVANDLLIDGDVLINGTQLAFAVNSNFCHAIVAGEQELVINGDGDFLKGVHVQSDLKVANELRVHGAIHAATDTSLLEIRAAQVNIKGSDLRLTGGRALVNDGNRLFINFNNDFHDVIVASSLQVQRDLRVAGVVTDSSNTSLMGNPAKKFMVVGTTANSPERNIFEADLIIPRSFLAFCIPAMSVPDVLPNVEVGIAAEVYAVDGNADWGVFGHGGGLMGPYGDARNIKWPYRYGFGQVISFRVSALGPNQYVGAIGIVFYE